MTAVEALRDALARIVVVRETLACGDTFEAALILADLEHDLAGELARLDEEPEP